MSNKSDFLYSNKTISIIDNNKEFEEEEVDIDDEINDEEIDNEKVDDEKDDNNEVDINRVDENENDNIINQKTGTSSIQIHLIDHGIKFEKEQQTTLNSFVKQHSLKI